MKIVVSLPVPLCAKVEQLATALGVLRSRLCAKAIADQCLGRRGDAAITDRLNAVYADQASDLPVELSDPQARGLSYEAR